MSTPPILASLDNVTVGYDRHPAIHHLRLQIADGDMLAVVGPNGAGKSTFLKLLTGEKLSVEGRFTPPDARQCRVAYLPQINQTDRQFPITVQDMVASGLWHRRGAFGWLGRADRARIDEVLDQVGMRAYARRVISALSGGEFQRVRFAQLMLQEARMVVLDEPFVGIDMSTTDSLLDLLAQWHAQGTTIVAALHEQDIVRRWFPRTLLIAREMIACGPTASVLTPENWQRALIRSAEARLPNSRWCEVPATGTDHAGEHEHEHE
ncbi:MAG: ABC transporter ATP-binding protein, partial [Lautropia sp.]|nr:ABC transporter ATP-binding protein [Lautropia sp.]